MKKFPGIPSTYGKCATCLHLDSRKCWMCNEKYLEKDMVFLTDNQGYVCKTCFDSNSIKCKQCGKEIINGLRNQIEVDYCNACASERAYVTKIEKLLNNDDVQVKYVTRTAFKNSYAPALMSRLHPAQKVNWGGDDKDSPIDILVIYSWDVGIVVISANSIPWKYIRDDKHKYTVSELKKDKNWRSIQYFNKEVLKSYEWNSQGNSDWDNSSS